MLHEDFQEAVRRAQVSYMSTLSPKCEKMAFSTGLNLNESPLFLPGVPTLSAQGQVPIRPQRCCVLILLETWACEREGQAESNVCGPAESICGFSAQGSHCNSTSAWQTFLRARCALGPYTPVHPQSGPAPLCELLSTRLLVN